MSDPDEDLDDETETTKSVFIGDVLRQTASDGRKLAATLTAIAGRVAGRVFRLGPGEKVLGRSPDVDLIVEDEGVSRRHVKFVSEGDSHVMVDLGSRNGTIHNGTRISAPAELRDGDRIRIGATTVFKFGYQDEIEEQLQAQLYDSATRDALTHAYNRRFFTERLGTEWAWAQRHKLPCALIAIDADHFKRINDGHGHAAGDVVLRELVATIQAVVRREDLLARIGGEEFVVLARGTTRAQASIQAERIRVAVEARAIVHNGTPLPVTISAGVSSSEDANAATPEDLLACADAALYRAKEQGRNRVEPPPKSSQPPRP